MRRPLVGRVLEIGVPKKLFDYRGNMALPQRNAFAYSVAADGRFLVNAYADAMPPAINLVTNWWKLAAEKGQR